MFDITLTFDNGPEPGVTDDVLDVLARHDIRATFFVLGHKLARPEGRKAAERAHAEGHWVGNHTWSHKTPLGLVSDPHEAEAEISRTQTEIGVLAHPQKLFRPFGGGGNLDSRLLSHAALDYLVRERFTCVLWNSIPRDWADPEGWVARGIEQALAQPWSLTVLHDLPTGAMRNLGRFLQEVLERGGRFRQDFPSACVPLRNGKIEAPLDPFVSSV
jgi:peptidoglycan-N-acetylglucosamine deacetylase